LKYKGISNAKQDAQGSDNEPGNNTFVDGYYSGLLTGCGKKDNCALFWRQIVRDKKFLAGNCVGLHNLVSNKISRIPLPVKVNIEFSL